MAKIIPSAIVSAISGALEGLIFSRRRAGIVVGTRPLLSRRVTPAKQTVQRAFGQAMAFWDQVDDGTRAAWCSAAQSFPNKDRMGFDRRLSGRQLFVKQLAWNDGAAYGPGLLPPTVSTPPILTLTATPGAGQIVLDWELFSDPGAGVRVKIRGYRPLQMKPITNVRTWNPLGIQTATYIGSYTVTPPNFAGNRPFIVGEYLAFEVQPMAYGCWLGMPVMAMVQFT